MRQLIDHIDDHLHCNITEVLDAFSFDNMCMLTFSDDVDSPVSQDTLHTVELLSESQRLLGTFGHVPWVYGIARYIPFLLRANSEFTHLASRKIERRQRRDGSELKDLFSYLLPGMSEPNSAQFPLEWEARLAMVVGSYVMPLHPHSISCNFY